MKCLCCLLLLAASILGAENQAVFTDGFEAGWENWSWAQTSAAASPVHGGGKSLAVTAGAWQAAYFHNSAIDATLYTNLTFWIHGGANGGQKLLVQGVSSGNAKSSVEIPALAANSWRQITVSLRQLGVESDPAFDGFWIQDRTGGAQPVFYLDDITLIAGAAPPPQTNSTASIVVDANLNRHPISDFIYGVAFASSAQLAALNAPLNRSGGNTETRYNWQANASNHAFDWYFESLAENSSTPGAAADDFMSATKSAGAEAMITIPLIGWVAKLGPNRARLSSFSIAKYGAQTDQDAQWFPDAGNGISSATGQPITWNDPNDANTPVDSTFQQEWVRHLTNRWGSAAQGGVRFYLMDNEPSLWHSTHRDVFPTGLRMADLRDRVIDYATKVRAVDPGAIIVGPEEWGWSGYLYSGYDQQWGSTHGWNTLPDRIASGGMDYLPWFLDQLRQHEQQTGQRLLDIFTVHYYPQGGEFSSDTSAPMQQRRNRSTRSLWDPNYTDASWINDKVRLIPRLKDWVNQYYPGTKIGLTEYSWGAEDHINGATAQADILGIFGREGLDYAARWVVPPSDSPAFKAFQMFRNYDGEKSHFGETSVTASVANPDNLAAFAAVRGSDGALTLMLINKLAAATPISLHLTNFNTGPEAAVWQLTSANQISHLPNIPVFAAGVTNILPAQSITLLVIPPAISAAAEIRLNHTVRSSDQVAFDLTGPPGATLELESSADLKSWTPLRTIILSAASTNLSLPITNDRQFFRASAH